VVETLLSKAETVNVNSVLGAQIFVAQ